MKLELILTLGAALALAPLAASAQNGYAGLSAGQSEQKADFGLGSSSDTTTAFKIVAGYQFHPKFGAEFGYVRHGEATLPLSGVIMKAKPESFYGAAIASYPLGTHYGLFGKLGLSHNRVKYGASTRSDTRPLTGVGVSMAFTQALSGVVEYEHFGKLVDDGGVGPSSNLLSIGLRSSF